MDLIEFFTRSKRDIDKIVDTTFHKLMEATDAINTIAPVQNYGDRSLLLLKMNRALPTIASIIAEDQEVPLSRIRATLSEELLSQCKMGKAYGFTDKHFELAWKLDQYASDSVRSSVADEIKRYFFGIAEDIPYGIVARSTQMLINVLTTGQCVFTDPITKAKVEMIYPNTDPTLLPAALAGNDLWSAAATANGLSNLRDHSYLYYDKFGKYPDYLFIRQQQIRQLAMQTSTKTAHLVNNGGIGAQAGDLAAVWLKDEQVTDMIRAVTNIENVEIFDAQYAWEAANGVISESYYLADGVYFFAERGIAERAFVPTAENDFLPGIYTVAERLLPKIPRREQIAGVANGIPACFDDRKIAARKVA